MRTSTAVIGVFLAGCLLATGCVHHHHHSQPVVVEPETTAGGPVGADPVVDMFYNDLAPYGEWYYIDGPGWVWSPYDVDVDWRPYQYGHWAYTDYGWTWASDEEFGWAVYHYGRWHQSPRYGWVWVPGSEWGPAWVAWQESDAWVGWAPLPYNVGWRAGVGLDWGHGNVHVSIQSGNWSFVATRYLVEPQVYHHIAPRTRNTTYIKTTRHVTNYTYIDNRVINNSVQVNNVVKAVGHPVRTHHVRHADKPGRTRGGRDDGDDLVIYRPREHPGRQPQRRPVPPGHDDEHQGKKDRRGQADSRGEQNHQGRNDGDERPAADRSNRGGSPGKSRAVAPATRPQRHSPDDDRQDARTPARVPPNKGRKTRPAAGNDHEPQSTSPRDRSQINGGKNPVRRGEPVNRQKAAPPDRSPQRDSKQRLQAAPPATRKPAHDERPTPSDYRRSEPRKTQPSATRPSGSRGQAATGDKAKGGKAQGSATKDNSSNSAGADSKKAKGGKSKGSPKKGSKQKPADPEEEKQDSGKKNSNKRD